MNKDLNKMTFRELKRELTQCNDPQRSMTIRVLMRNIYKNYIQHKQPASLTDEDLVNQILDEYKKKQYIPPDFGDDKKKFKEEIEKDSLNNGLMNRLNGELHMRKNKNKNKQRDFLPPFGTANGSKYAPYNNNSKSITNFSTPNAIL